MTACYKLDLVTDGMVIYYEFNHYFSEMLTIIHFFRLICRQENGGHFIGFSVSKQGSPVKQL